MADNRISEAELDELLSMKQLDGRKIIASCKNCLEKYPKEIAEVLAEKLRLIKE